MHPLLAQCTGTCPVLSQVEFVTGPRPFFRVNGKRMTGLTKRIARILPVPKHNARQCPSCRRKRSRAKLVHACGVTMHSSRSKKARRALAPIGAARRDDRLARCMGASARAHGSIVDRQLTALAAGTRVAPLDGCTASLLAYIHRRGWVLLATQLPMYSPTLGIATAIDLVCTDAATRTQCIVCEVKATRTHGLDSQLTDETCYTAARTTIDAFPASYYIQHQLQLFSMWYALHVEARVPVHAALVLRASPGGVDVYPLPSAWKRQPQPVLDLLRS